VTFLVDASVLSEGTKPSPELKVLGWLRANEAELAVDPIRDFQQAGVKVFDPFA
jgi:hypothetical protein